MANRIPPSLAWLIDKRARIDGEIQKTKKAISQVRALLRELKSIEGDLAAIDRAMALHDIEVNLELIRPIRSQQNRIKAPHGLLTRLLLQRLAAANGQPVPTSDLAAFVAVRFEEAGVEAVGKKRLHHSVRERLKCLLHEGRVCRHHPELGNKMGRWSANETDFKK